MGKYSFIIIGLCLVVASFFISGHVSNQVGSSMVWTLRMIGVSFMVLPVVLGGVFLFYKKKKKKARLFFKQNGIEAMAILLSANRTGVYINRVPQFLFEFRIKAENREEFNTSVKKYIRFVDLSQIVEGMKIPAYIHPEDPEKVLVMWEKAGIGDAF